ncbi:WD40-repeat-containing domain protein [Lactarius pseudohatsudake]|nr:WD40-repeat-containing domain protein [Lactarius pseudohatsudake]
MKDDHGCVPAARAGHHRCQGLGILCPFDNLNSPLETMSSVLKYKKRFERCCHDGAITSVALNPRGNILAVGSLDGSISVWAVDTGSALHRVNARTPIHSLVWSTGSEGFVFGCENGVLVSILLEEACVKTVYFHAHSRPIYCLSPFSNDELLISGAVNEVTVWKRDRHNATRDETWEAFKIIPQPPEQYSRTGRVVKVTSVNWLQNRNSSEGGQKFILTSYLWHGVMCWDLASLAIMWRLAIPDCLSLALTLDGSLVAAYGASDSFEVHDTRTRRLMQALPWEARPDPSSESPPVAFAHEGFAIISGGQGKASIWDVEHGDELQTLIHGGTGRITALTAYSSASADRFLVVTGTDEGESSRIVIWDTIPYGSEANTAAQAAIIRDPLANRVIWMMVGVAALLSWRWIAPTSG